MDPPGSRAVLGTTSGAPPMALGRPVLGAAEGSAKPDEIAFVGSDYMITVVPSMPMGELRFIGGTFGPLIPGIMTDVPLWLAVNLKKREKCHIQAPNWLGIEYLEQCLREEKTEDSSFFELPFEFMEVWHELEAHASDDIEAIERVRVLIVDLFNERRKKLIVGLHTLDASTTAVALNGLTHMELNMARTHYVRTMNSFRAIGKEDLGLDAGTGSGGYFTQTESQTQTQGRQGPLRSRYRGAAPEHTQTQTQTQTQSLAGTETQIETQTDTQSTRGYGTGGDMGMGGGIGGGSGIDSASGNGNGPVRRTLQYSQADQGSPSQDVFMEETYTDSAARPAHADADSGAGIDVDTGFGDDSMDVGGAGDPGAEADRGQARSKRLRRYHE